MKRTLRIIIIVVVALGVGVGLWVYLNGYLLKSKATGEVAKVRFSQALVRADGDAEVRVDLILTTEPSTHPGISGVDLSFTNTGTNLEFLSTKTTATVPVGFDESMLDEAGMTVGTTPKQLKRLVFVSKKPAAQLQKSIIIPLYFKVLSAGQASAISTVTVDINASQVVGPPGITYPVTLDATTPNFTLILATPPNVTPGSGNFNLLTPPPIIAGMPLGDANTTTISERGDLLYINSIASYPAPFRYEQPIKLEKGTYHLTVNAKVYVRRGRGMVVTLVCNEARCGDKVQNQTFYATAPFPVKAEFSQLTDTITIPDNADNKQFVLRIFCEDGSECELDTISLEDAWGSERVANNDFADIQKLSDPRKQPNSWEVDSTANLYGSVDPAFGHNGSLMINNSIK